MAEYYILDAEQCDDWISFSVPESWNRGCLTSEFQYIPAGTERLEVTAGTELYDFSLVNEFIPVISKRMKEIFEKLGVDNLYYKKILLDYYGQEEEYWLALPPRIKCVDPDCADDDFEAFGDIHDARILDDRVGNYQMFKLSGVGNQEIVIRKNLKQQLEECISEENLRGMYIYQL